MFHVEQFDFARPFHVEQKYAKSLLNSRVLALFWRLKNNFRPLSELFLIEKFSFFHPNFSPENVSQFL